MRPDFPAPYGSPADGLRGKTSIFSHPVYLLLREFHLQDSRDSSQEFCTLIILTMPLSAAQT
ncbi:hypothetical protein DEN86_23970 [Escherichia coli]|uniref:Uncharacterized protein n=1 Tax=Escherichia coli TaxID=562 RepID=A0A2J1C1C9_ECOLX|nr:hypothetical protein [Escherichia coli]PJX95201.1 hypothetical protein CWM24_23515 [Escherichia coli]TFY44170.1 hypothetical protein DEN86_23970 [Escherichia coli]TGD21352.1 hypothetical protein DXT71_25605 [Escherichia coli]TGD62365.1 hypothetical protein DXT73_21995 [Escherichia coli]